MAKDTAAMLLLFCSICIVNTLPGNEFDWESTEGVEGLHFKTRHMEGLLVGQDTRDLGRGFGKHGIRGLTYKGHDLSAPEPPVGGKRKHQGVLNLYRVYSSTESFGSLRDDQAQLERLDDGVRLTWPASEGRPVTISGTWRITGPAHFDLFVEATPTKPISNFEILPAVYLAVHMGKFIYLDGDNGSMIHALRSERQTGDPLHYAFYPLGEKARPAQENSGRIHSDWKWKTVVPKERAVLPIVFAGDETVQVVLMGEANSISAVCATPLPTTGSPEEWNSVEQHSALYFSVFGHDVEPGNTYIARMRLQVIDKPADTKEAHRQLYEAFLAETFYSHTNLGFSMPGSFGAP